MISTTLTASQRDLLYHEIVIRLSGISEVFFAIEQRDFDAAERLSRDVSDDLLFLLDDLGFGDGTGETVELTTPADRLRRVISRICQRALDQRSIEAEKIAEAGEEQQRVAGVVHTCQHVLARLEINLKQRSDPG